MGLDLYLERVTKPSIDKSKTYTGGDLYDMGLNYVTEEELAETKKIPAEMLDKVTEKVTISYYVLDNVKIWKAFAEQYPESYSSNSESPTDFAPAIIGGTNNNEKSTFTFEDDYGNQLKITVEKDDNEYFKKEETLAYVYKTEELDYQRKGINAYGWSLLPENCTYCFDKSLVQELVDEGDLSESFIDNWVDGETALFAWW